MYKKYLFASAIILLGLSGYLFFRHFSVGIYSPLSWKCWLISIAMLLITFLPLSVIPNLFPPHHIPLPRGERITVRGWFFVSFLLIIAAGVFFRLYKLDCFPWGLEGMTLDTAFGGEYAFKILDGEPYTPIGISFLGCNDTLPFYLQALFFSMFGSTLFVLRCETMFISLVNAVLVFFVTKAILRNRNPEDNSNIALLALSGMGLYLFSAVDTVLNYSAFERNITTPVVLASFLSLIWAFRRRSYFSFCLAGSLFGLLLVSSKYCISTLPAFVIVILYYAISDFFGWFKSERSGWYVKIGLFFLGAIFVVLPKVLWCILCDSNAYFFRVFLVTDVDPAAKEQGIIVILNSFVSKLNPAFLVSKLNYTYKLMFVEGFHDKFLLGNTAIVDKFVMPIFFLGVIYSLARIKSKGYLFSVCYLLFNTIVMCIIVYPMFDYRFTTFMPFVYIFSSIGFDLINKLLKYRKMFYIIAGIYVLVIVSFNVKNYYTGMGVMPLASFYNVKNTLLGRYLQNNFLDKRVYVILGNCEWATKFSTYNYRERDIDRPTGGFWRYGQRCGDFSYSKVLSNISWIIADNLNAKKDMFFIFDDASCNEEIASRLESVFSKKRSSFLIYSKSCKENFTYVTFEIRKDELASIGVANIVPQYTGKRYGAQKKIKPEGLIKGIAGKYYADARFGKLIDTKIDKCIDFNWMLGSPLPSIKPDYFSIEWNGYIRADADEVYWFFIRSDNGARLWIDDDLVIDNWNSNVSDELCKPVFLERGLHKIKLQYFESEGFASVSLSWASERLWKSTVPSDHLFCVSEE